MKLLNNLLALFCCLSIVACSAMTPEQERQLSERLAASALPPQQRLANWALRLEATRGRWDVATDLLLHSGADRMVLDAAQQASLRNYIFTELHAALSNYNWQAFKQLLSIISLQELSDEQQSSLYTSTQVHNYLLTDLHAALYKYDWQAVEQVLNIIPYKKLPIYARIQIEPLIATATTELAVTLNLKGLPQSAIRNTLSFYIGSTAFGIYARLEEKALATQGANHEIN